MFLVKFTLEPQTFILEEIILINFISTGFYYMN